MTDLGQILVLLSILLTGVAMLAYLPGVRREPGRPVLKIARPAVYLNAAVLLMASAYLWKLIITHQYQFDYVYRYSSNDMPFRYVFASFWGGQEGTFLLWAAFGGLLAVFLRFKSKQYEAPVQFFYLGINLFLMFMLVKASPFSKLPVTPVDGNGLNPLLQDPWMTIHPPVMFFGFASLGIPAAYAMAAMVKEDWDSWVRRAIPWTTFGIMALGMGLVMGGYWAYSILGWGGFWGWDPVENSSLVPWLVAIALLHNQVIQLVRGIFRRSNLFLAMMPFVLLTYSTFLTRSGVLADFSVHSFTDLGINQFLVAFMVVFLGGGFGLFILKFRKIPVDKAQAPLFSREYFMFLGALAFGLFAIFVLLGTSAPLLTRLWGPPANVQPEFYNRFGLPFAILITLLMGTAPFLVWKRMDVRGMFRRVMIPGILTLISIPVLIMVGIRDIQFLLMTVGGVFAALANTQMVIMIMRRNRTAMGGYLAHVGMGLSVVGILTSTAYNEKSAVVLPEGEEVMALGYGFSYMGHRQVEEGRKDAYDVALRTSGGKYIVSPTMFFSDFNQGMMKKPDIKSFFARDVYISPIGHAVDPLEDRIETRLMLGTQQPTPNNDVVFTLKQFHTEHAEIAPHAGEGGAYESAADEHTGRVTDVKAEIDVQVNGTTQTIFPVLRTFKDNHTEALPVELPGTGYNVRLLGIDGSNSFAQVGVQRPPVVLKRGESGVIDGTKIFLESFDVESPTRKGGSVKVFAHVQVDMGGHVFHVRPGLISRPGAEELELIEAPIGRTGLNLVLQYVESADASAYFHIAPEPREYFYAEVSTKPFIILLWIGTIVTLVGLVTATLHRGRMANRVRAAVVGERNGAKNGKREAA